MFVGRLTEELLEKRLKGKSIKDVSVLDLTNCKLRDFDEIFTATNFPKLQDLSLNHNNFTSLKIFGQLPHLRHLKINNNKIESFMISSSLFLQKKSLQGLNCLTVQISPAMCSYLIPPSTWRHWT